MCLKVLDIIQERFTKLLKKKTKNSPNYLLNKVSQMISYTIIGITLITIGVCVYNSYSKANVVYDEEKAKEYYKLDLSQQINDLFDEVSEDTQIDKKYIDAIYLLANRTAIFEEEEPNIYMNTTMVNYKAPFDIQDVKQEYKKKYINNKTLNGQPITKYYFPDATYNVALTLKKDIIARRNISRKNRKEFENFKPNVQEKIIYYETILKYLGWSNSKIEDFTNAYIDILSLDKEKELPLVEKKDTNYIINNEYAKILLDNDIQEFDDLAKIMYGDEVVLLYNNYESLSNSVSLPYRLNLRTKLNLLTCACSQVGKVRYVWGGGHQGTSNIEGINPLWKEFNDFYINSGHNEDCIQPAYSWCPIHGKMENTENSCLEIEKGISNLDDFFNDRENIYTNLNNREKKNIIKNSAMSTYEFGENEKVSPHRFEGLDCSGYIAWCYHQIDTSKSFDTSAKDFIEDNSDFEKLPYGAKLKPCDLIAWNTHIVMVVGAFSNTTYLIIESSPCQLRFGIATYTIDDEKTIEKAKEYIMELNQKFGGDTMIDDINVHNIRTRKGLSLGRYTNFGNEDYINKLTLNNLMIAIQENLQ